MNLHVTNILYETAVDLAKHPSPNGFVQFLEFAWIPIVEVVAGIIIGPWVKKLIGKMAVHSQDKGLVTFLGSAANMSIITLTCIMAAEALGVRMNSVISLITAMGLGVSLALKGNMANVAGGLQILITKPFQVGDYIRISPHKGYVTSLELMFTTMKTDNGKEVIIPNSTVIEDMIINYSKYPNLRIRVPFQVGLGLDYPALKKSIVDLMKSNPYLESDEPIHVTTKAISTSAVTLELVGYVKVQNIEHCKHRIYDMLSEGLPVYNSSSPSVTQVKMVNPVEYKPAQLDSKTDSSSSSESELKKDQKKDDQKQDSSSAQDAAAALVEAEGSGQIKNSLPAETEPVLTAGPQPVPESIPTGLVLPMFDQDDFSAEPEDISEGSPEKTEKK